MDRADPSEVLRRKLPPVQFVSAGKHDILVQVQLSMLPLLLSGGVREKSVSLYDDTLKKAFTAEQS